MSLFTKKALTDIYLPVEKEMERAREVVSRQVEKTFFLLDGACIDKAMVDGKFIRSALVLFSSLLSGSKEPQRFVKMASACELIHMASLIHDDVVDEAMLRRGTLSMKARWDNKLAVLAGDHIISQALCLLSTYDHAQILKTMMKNISDMAQGELWQTVKSKFGSLSEEEYFLAIKDKTSSFMLTACIMPAQLQGSSKEVEESLRQFGLNFGMAFQLMDDLMDFIDDEASFGKPPFGDIRMGKQTLPIIHLQRVMDKEHLTLLDQLLEHPSFLDDGRKDWLLECLSQYKTDQYCRGIAHDYMQKARDALRPFEDSSSKRALLQLCNFILQIY